MFPIVWLHERPLEAYKELAGLRSLTQYGQKQILGSGRESFSGGESDVGEYLIGGQRGRVCCGRYVVEVYSFSLLEIRLRE